MPSPTDTIRCTLMEEEARQNLHDATLQTDSQTNSHSRAAAEQQHSSIAVEQ